MNELPDMDEMFLEIKGYQRFEEFCDSCIEYKYLGICYGSPGVGKTQSAEHYSKRKLILSANPNGYAIEDNRHVPTELYSCSTVFYTPIAPLSSLQMLNTLNQNICYFDRVVLTAA